MAIQDQQITARIIVARCVFAASVANTFRGMGQGVVFVMTAAAAADGACDATYTQTWYVRIFSYCFVNRRVTYVTLTRQ